MSPRTASSITSRGAAPTRTTRSSRNSLAAGLSQEEKKAPPPLSRRPLKSAISSKKSVTAKRVTQAARADGSDSGDDQSDSGTDADAEDADKDDADEPEVFAPSERITRKRGHQTGLSLSLSHTTIDAGPRGIKRELSTSSIDTSAARPTKQAKRGTRAATLKAEVNGLSRDYDDDDDDEAYNAVNDISESDESDRDIERAEKQNIIDTFEEIKPRTPDEWDGTAWDGIAGDDESPFFSEHFAVTEPNSEIELGVVDNSKENTSPSSNSAPTRRVRFADVASTSSSSTEEYEVDNTTFPDLMLDQGTPHHSAPQLFDVDDGVPLHSDESIWDFQGEIEMPPPKSKVVKPLESADEFNGYETDDSSEGQETDEETVPLSTVHHPHTRLHADSSRKKTAPSSRANLVARARRQNQQHSKQGAGPTRGDFPTDSLKPSIHSFHDARGRLNHLWYDPVTRRMRSVYSHDTGSTHAGVRNDISSTGSSPSNVYMEMPQRTWPRQTWPGTTASQKSSDSDGSHHGHGFHGAVGHMPRSSSDVMTQGLPRIDTAGREPLLNPSQVVISDDEEDTDEAKLDIKIFLNLSDDDSDSNDGDHEAVILDEWSSPLAPLSTQRLPTITPKHSRSGSSSQHLLEHFNKGVVSAFRRNQSRHQAALRQPSTGARVQAIKGGRHVAADSPITPIRKRKGERSMSSSMAPFTGVNTARLRSGTA